jgi:hypothetical protein
MATNPYVDRIAQAADITESQASLALTAAFQGLINTIVGNSASTISIASASTSGSGVQTNIMINNPPHPGTTTSSASTLVAYIASQAGIGSAAAATALSVVIEEIDEVGSAALD